MAFTEAVEKRVDFALNSPDFWRGLGIALAVLAALVVVRSIVRVAKSPDQRQLTSSKWSQLSGLGSWLMMAAAAVGYQWTRFGEPEWTFRLPLTLVGGFLAIVWSVDTIRVNRQRRKYDDYQKKH